MNTACRAGRDCAATGTVKRCSPGLAGSGHAPAMDSARGAGPARLPIRRYVYSIRKIRRFLAEFRTRIDADLARGHNHKDRVSRIEESARQKRAAPLAHAVGEGSGGCDFRALHRKEHSALFVRAVNRAREFGLPAPKAQDNFTDPPR